MSKLTLNFVSEALYRAIPLTVIMPTDHMVLKDQKLPELNKPYKTLYYLEGLLGDCSGPCNYSRLQTYAEDYNMCVVVVGGENKWYCDSKITKDFFGTLIARDIVNFTRRMLQISRKWEDTYIGGFSMGGHGALTVGLAHPDVFSKIVTIDAAFHREVFLEAPEIPTWDNLGRREYMTMLGVDKMEDFLGTVNDYDAMADKVAEMSKEMQPKIYVLCGEKDCMFELNHSVYQSLVEKGLDAIWSPIEGGAHSNWTIDQALPLFFEWLQVTVKSPGV